MITYNEAHEWFRHDASTGILYWKKSRKTGKAGMEAGWSDSSKPGYTSYRKLQFKGTSYYTHRIIWLMSYVKWPRHYIDHIDGNGLNNRIHNLREATRSQNQRNCHISKANKTGLKGVSFNKAAKKFTARIHTDKGRLFLGYYETSVDAAIAYVNAAKKYHGAFANPKGEFGTS